MNERETERLKARLMATPPASFRRAAGRTVSLFVAAVVLCGLAVLFRSRRDALIGSTVLFGLATYFVIALELQKGSARRRIEKTVRAALSAGHVEVERVESTAVVEFAEHSDEGPNYYFEVEADQLYAFSGQDANDIDGDPNSCFEIIRVLEPPTYLSVFNYGKPFVGHRVIQDYDYGDLPRESGLIVGTIASLVETVVAKQSAS